MLEGRAPFNEGLTSKIIGTKMSNPVPKEFWMCLQKPDANTLPTFEDLVDAMKELLRTQKVYKRVSVRFINIQLRNETCMTRGTLGRDVESIIEPTDLDVGFCECISTHGTYRTWRNDRMFESESQRLFQRKALFQTMML